MSVYQLPLSVVFLACVFPSVCLAEHPEPDTAIIAGPRTGEPDASKPAVPRKQRSWDIRSTSVRRVGGRSVTIQEVEPPPFDAPVSKAVPAPLPPAEDPALRHTLVARPAMRVIGVSATIYGKGAQKRTRLTISTLNKDFHAWSNIDYRHMDGLILFRANGREYFIFATHLMARDAKGRIKTLKDALADGCPRGHQLASRRAAFAVANDKQSRSPLARDILHDLHTLYRKEKKHLEAAFHYRKQKAALRKPADQPPPPKPVTIRYWKRDMQKEREQRQAQQERGAK